MNGWPRRIAVAATSLAVVACVAVFVLSLVPRYPCTLLEHFRVQSALGGLVIAAAAGALQLRGYLPL